VVRARFRLWLTVAIVALSAGCAFGQNLFPLPPFGDATEASPPGTITAEFPDWTPGERPFQDPVGGVLVITSLNDNRISWNPDDGIISLYEARIYARNDIGPNTIYFHPGFGKITIAYDYFTLPSPEDTFQGRELIRGPGGRWGEAGSVSGVFVDGVLEVTGDNAKVHNNYVGLDWDKVTPLSNVYWPTIALSGKHGRAYENTFCADPVDGKGGSLTVGGEDNWAYSNVIGLQNDLLTPQSGVPEVGLYVSGKGNRIGDKANCSNHIFARGTCIEITGQGHVVRSNAIGRNTAGQTCQYGIELKPPTEGKTTGNYIGGPSGQPGLTHNIISHFTEAGVVFRNGCNNNAMGGNLIGLKPNGRLDLPRGKTGVVIGANTTGNEIGGSSAYYVNWIAGQTQQAILVQPGADKVQIQGCHIGFDCDLKGIHQGHGVVVVGGKEVLIGGVRESAASDNGNLIGGCKGDAIRLEGCTGPIAIQSNRVGVNPAGDLAMPNGGAAVRAIGSSEIYIGVDAPTAPAAVTAEVTRRNLFTNCATGVSIIGPAQGGVIANSRIEGNAGSGIVLDGSRAEVTGMTVGNLNSQSDPNEIVNNGGFGILVKGAQAHGNSILGNWVGVLPSPTTLIPQRWEAGPNRAGGIQITGRAHHNTVGQGPDLPTNRTCSNGGPGVHLGGRANNNLVVNNWIGRERAANSVPGNSGSGVLIDSGARDNTLGSQNPVGGNFIAANAFYGVEITGADTYGNAVLSGCIGANGRWSFDGLRAYPDHNTLGGILISGGAHENTIGDDSEATYGVVVSGNWGPGITITGAASDRNRVMRCRTGCTPDGTAGGAAWDNEGPGIAIKDGAAWNVIGGRTRRGNQIANNTGPGILIAGPETRNNDILGNLIGTHQDGAQALGNKAEGIRIVDSDKNRVGLMDGPTAAPNTISGNALDGVQIKGPQATGNQVAHNLIGTNSQGTAKLANGRHGVLVSDGASWNEVGPGNTVSGNGEVGVYLWGGAVNDNTVSRNVIGLRADKSGFLPNGAAGSSETAVAIRAAVGGAGAPPARNDVTDNWIYAEQVGILFVDVAAPSDRAEPTVWNRAARNKIGFRSGGAGKSCDVGIRVTGCEAFLDQNEIARTDIGVQALGAGAYAAARRCRFHDNRIHVQFTQNASGMLGRYVQGSGDRTRWNWGENEFYRTNFALNGHWAIDAFEIRPADTILAENCFWWTNVRATIEKEIRYRDGDAQKASVDFDPLLGGVSPLGTPGTASSATVVGLTIQPTNAGAAVTLTLSADAAVTVQVLNIAGRPIRTVVADRPCPAGVTTLAWNGLSDLGTPAPTGRYLVQVSARAADGGRSRALAACVLQR